MVGREWRRPSKPPFKIIFFKSGNKTEKQGLGYVYYGVLGFLQTDTVGMFFRGIAGDGGYLVPTTARSTLKVTILE